MTKISIHAPHEGERPIVLATMVSASANFNPRSPRGGATSSVVCFGLNFSTFQSTLPTRGSDAFITSMSHGSSTFQSPLPTRGSDRNLYHA